MQWPDCCQPADIGASRLLQGRQEIAFMPLSRRTVIWAAHSSTRNLGSVQHELRDLADAIVHALHEDRWCRPQGTEDDRARH
jgi:hypothetical protein